MFTVNKKRLTTSLMRSFKKKVPSVANEVLKHSIKPIESSEYCKGKGVCRICKEKGFVYTDDVGIYCISCFLLKIQFSLLESVKCKRCNDVLLPSDDFLCFNKHNRSFKRQSRIITLKEKSFKWKSNKVLDLKESRFYVGNEGECLKCGEKDGLCQYYSIRKSKNICRRCFIEKVYIKSDATFQCMGCCEPLDPTIYDECLCGYTLNKFIVTVYDRPYVVENIISLTS